MKINRLHINVGNAYSNTYLRYDVKIYNAHSGLTTRLYRGKTLCLGGYVDVDVQRVIDTYTYKSDYVTASREYQVDRVETLPLAYKNGIDNEKIIVNTTLQIDVYEDNDSSVRVTSEQLPVTIFEGYADPYQNNTDSFIDYNNSVLINHIPFVYTNNYWIGFNYAITSTNEEGFDNTIVAVLDNGSDVGVKLCDRKQQWGNYIFNIPLRSLFDSITTENTDAYTTYVGSDMVDRLVGGDAYSVYIDDNTPIGADTSRYSGLFGRDKIYLNHQVLEGGKWEYKKGNLLTVVDECPKGYYLQWRDKNGWHSVSVNVEEVLEVDRATIKNIYNETKVVGNHTTRSFKIRSNKLTHAEYKDFKNVVTAPYVWLYNVEEDEVYCCTVTTNSMGYNKHFCTFEIKHII